ncbi:DUF4864 domain-containing protein [Rhizobium sp. SSA_523]|uniref:DUF4864 domain-containing protein n=1 Tax=Rhizobium sp. SSA_523 TaxID=2952477 RepID=UPI0020911DEE|nr:DUF4864 domain-containing protein [Rhizobium sp. SSA_523]MCO5733766.1 DUF4864 domain-containing protein [Rhizobium sp. SSA_523]WKC24958.1 DUF4864 domain-containing protein [Rhizobium sp. SSA_523]
MPVRFVALLICLWAGSFASLAAEDAVTSAQKIIADQIQALKKGDSATAYSFASPAIRSLFPSDGRFLAMVRQRYAPLANPGFYAFGRSKSVGGGELVLQEVIVTSQNAKDWSAIYEMRLQDDGSYKVNGVRVLEKTASTGI